MNKIDILVEKTMQKLRKKHPPLRVITYPENPRSFANKINALFRKNLQHLDSPKIVSLITDNFYLEEMVSELKESLWQAEEAIEKLKIVQLKASELEELFESRHAADVRAIEMWRSGGPDKELKWPDHADLVVWLLDYIDKMEIPE